MAHSHRSFVTSFDFPPFRAIYRGRFAPSPTGPLHDGSLVAALASWLDARAHCGTWLVRMEDIDPPRCQPEADKFILQQLMQVGLLPDEPPVWQSQRHAHYANALEQLQCAGWAYPCGCTRKTIEAFWQQQGATHVRHAPRPYPGICRNGLHGEPARSWRFHLEKLLHNLHPQTPLHVCGAGTENFWLYDEGCLQWQDRRLKLQTQYPAHVAGDLILRRADSLWSYQLAVVVDDALQGITHVVRGEDLADNTPRQLLLQQALGLQHPHYLHTPLVCQADGEKLSKQHGAQAVDLTDPLTALLRAGRVLGLSMPWTPCTSTLTDVLHQWVQQWRTMYPAL